MKDVDWYYCPKCLDLTLSPNNVKYYTIDIKPGECVSCLVNAHIHSKYEHIGEGKISEEEMKEFMDDPARKTDPRFSQEAYDARVNYVPIEYDRFKAGGVSCPYCHSTSTRKISTASKAWNVALFGLYGNKRKMQWHCNDCGSDF